MARADVERRWRSRAVAGAVFALVIHLGALGFLIMAAPGLLPHPSDERSISVDLVTPAGRLISRPRPASHAAPLKKVPVASPRVEMFHSTAVSPDVATASILPRPATAPAITPQAGMPAGLALRNSIIGCGFAGIADLSDAERRHCHDVFAAGRNDGPDLSGLGLDPVKKAGFDAAAEREKFLQKPFLSQRPKNGCKPFVDHQQYATLGASRDAYSVSFGCGKTF